MITLIRVIIWSDGTVTVRSRDDQEPPEFQGNFLDLHFKIMALMDERTRFFMGVRGEEPQEFPADDFIKGWRKQDDG